MTKYLKYLISLFLAFGLMVNDCILDSQSNSADYYQVSYVKIRNEFRDTHSKLYLFNQINSSKKTSFPTLLAYLKFKDIYSLQIRVLLKLQKVLYQKVSSFTTKYLFLNEMITSRNSYKNLYIA